MSILLGSPLSAPAERVDVKTELTTERFSRTLDERHPYARSSTAVIVPMADQPMHPDDALVVRWSVRALVVLALVFAAEWFHPEWLQP